MTDDIFDPDHIKDTVTEPVAEVAVRRDSAPVVADDEELDPGWEHERIEYMGDNLAVQMPRMNALTAVQMSGGKYIDQEIKNDVTSYFMYAHLGPKSYDRVMHRLISPNDVEYPENALLELFQLIFALKVDSITKASESDA